MNIDIGEDVDTDDNEEEEAKDSRFADWAKENALAKIVNNVNKAALATKIQAAIEDIDQHSEYHTTWDVTKKLWNKAERETDWEGYNKADNKRRAQAKLKKRAKLFPNNAKFN